MRRPMAEQPATREGRVGLGGKSERPVLPEKPGNAGGGKGPWFKSNARRSKGKEIGMSLITPESVWQLQEALQAKAKSEPACRFHSLYDKLYRKDVLLHAWRCCRATWGTAIPNCNGTWIHRRRWMWIYGCFITATLNGPNACMYFAISSQLNSKT